MAYQEHFIRRETAFREGEGEEVEEEDPPNETMDLEKQLTDFRQQWQKELEKSNTGCTSKSSKDTEDEPQKGLPRPSLTPAKNLRSWPYKSAGDAPPGVVSCPARGVANAQPELCNSDRQNLAGVTVEDNSGQQQQQQAANRAASQTASQKTEDENANMMMRREEMIEIKAKELFIQGVSAERRGNLTEAICKYRHAIQLVPDVESKITDYTLKKDDEPENDIQEGYEDEDFGNAAQDGNEVGLESALKALTTNDIKSHCDPEFQQTSTHISALPVELLLYIFRWVVSSELDLRSLELLSSVCRGFYVCARDPSLWHRACLRVFGPNCCQTKEYGTWRQMYLERPHPNFSGVYISRNTYFRKGEQDMDGLYRPWHMVEYYRYVRLFPDGTMLMYSAPDEPLQVVSKLQTQTTSLQSVLIGHYRISGDMVTGVLRRENTKVYDHHLHRYIRYKRHMSMKLDTDHTFYLELCIRACGQRPNRKLEWHSYTCHTHHRPTGNTNITEFDVDKKFKPLIFSRVKSYTKTSEKPM